MDEHPNAGRIRRYYEALGSGDFQTLVELIDSECVFHIPGDSPLTGEYRGLEQIATLGMRVAAETGGTWKTELIDVLANDAYAVTLHRWTAERNGRRIEQRNFNVYRFSAAGRIVRRWEFVEDQAAHDAFWS